MKNIIGSPDTLYNFQHYFIEILLSNRLQVNKYKKKAVKNINYKHSYRKGTINKMGKIEQGKFYHIMYMNGIKDVLETPKTLKTGRYYRLKDGREFKVIRQAHFKYTYDDIDTVRVLTEGYDIGTLQHRLSQKMARAFKSKTPSVRFTAEEREMLSYIYYENEFITDNDKRVLEKILEINK